MSDQLRAMLHDLAQDAPTSVAGSPVARGRSRRVRALALVAAVVVLGGVLTAVVQRDGTPTADRLVQPPDEEAPVILALGSGPRSAGEPADLIAVDPDSGRVVRTVRAGAIGVGGTGQATVRPQRVGRGVLAIAPGDPCNRTVVSIPDDSGAPVPVGSETDQSIVSFLDSDDPDVRGWLTQPAVGDCATGPGDGPSPHLVVLQDGRRRDLVLIGGAVVGAAYDRRATGGRVVTSLDGRLQVLDLTGVAPLEALDAPRGCVWELPTPGRRAGEVLVVQRCSGAVGGGNTVVAVDTDTGEGSPLALLPITRTTRSIDLDPSGRRLLVDEPQAGDAIQVVGDCVDNPCDRFPATGFPDDDLGLLRSQESGLDVYRVTSRRASLPLWG